MRSRTGAGVTSAWVIAAAMMLLAALPPAAGADAEVRFVNAAPGNRDAEVAVDGRRVGGPLAFGAASERVRVDPGTARFEIGKERGRATFRNGRRYTVVAGGGEIVVARDDPARAGRARLRVLHVAPELGEADFLLGSRRLAAGIARGRATVYRTVEPGTYRVAATAPGGSSALVESSGVALAAGTASTAIVAGSGGEPLRILVLGDAAYAPRAAPATGLGGLARVAGGWLTVVLAVLAALALLPAFAVGTVAAPVPPVNGGPPPLAQLTSLVPAAELPGHTPALRPVVAAAGRAGLRVPELESLAGGIRPAAPARIRIPAAGVDAAVDRVRASRRGVDVPPPGRAGWIDSGPRPGERGRAVVIGHLDSADGPGLFAHIPRIPSGTLIEVTDERGAVRRFRAVSSAQVEKERFPAEAVYGAASVPVLVLVTCGGPYLGARGYRDNVLVYARAA